MAPKAKAKASGSKRKVEERDSDPEEETQRVEESQASGSSKSLKRAKTEYFQNGQPKNKVLPVKIEFAKRDEDALRIATWNVCGLAASLKKVRGPALQETARVLTRLSPGIQILRSGGGS
jgi:AP endonuclease-1